MSLGEFKAWLAGYLESCSASPAKRVKRIEEKIAEVCERSPVTGNVPFYPWHWTWTPTITTGTEFTWTVSSDADTIVCNDVIGTGTTTVGYLSAGVE